jgi:S-formylglutathione hydrolase FrmB
MRKAKDLPEGTVHRLTHVSQVLAGNPLGDPVKRDLQVYTPAGWTKSERLALFVDMPGWGKGGQAHTNWQTIVENVPERLDRLIGSGALARVVVAFPDCFTRLGGNQYINSVGSGRYEDYLIREIVPTVEREFNCGGDGRRACFGKSSGGYGAIWHALHHGGFWAAASCNSGDMGFQGLMIPEMYRALEVLQVHGFSVQRFIEHLEGSKKPTQREMLCRMFIAMGAFYDPDPGSFMNIRLPVEPYTAELIPERWANWMRHDPAEIVSECGDSLRRLKGLWIDCGSRDQFFLQYGMRRLSRSLKQMGIEHVCEEFDDDHTDVDYRMDRFLPFLAGRLAA